MKFAPSGLFLGLSLALAGCGGAKLHEVSGTVTFEGEPVKEGHIAFVPEGGGPGGGGPITDGRYAVKAQGGRNRVEINASKTTKLPPGEVGMGGAKEEVRPYIPEKYNTKTELMIDVTGPTTKDFPLKK